MRESTGRITMSDLANSVLEALEEGRGRYNPRKKGDRQDRYMLGGVRQKLVLRGEYPGHVTRVFNDDGSRVQDALRAGWVPILKNEQEEFNHDSPVSMDQWMSQVVDKTTNPPMRGFFMKIKEEFYKEDQAAKQREIDKIDKAIAGGNFDDEQSQQLQRGTSYVKTLSVNNNFKR